MARLPMLVLLLVVACQSPVVEGPSGLVVAITPEAPLAGDALDAVIVTDAVVSDGSVPSYAYAWTQDGALVYTDMAIPADETARGEVWELVVTPSGPEEDTGAVPGEPASAYVVIGDSPPVLDAVAIGPGSPTESSVLSVTLGSAHDVDGDAIAFRYDWYVDGALVRSEDEGRLTGADFSKGDDVYVAVTPSDDVADGQAVLSNTLTVRDSAPSFDAVELSPDPLYADSVAACVPSGWTDPDGDAEGYTFIWYVEGDAVGSEATLSAAFVRGDEVQCQATAWDGELEGPTVASAIATVANSAPVLASASLTIASPTTADTESLALGTGSDADGDYIVYQYAWFVNGAAAGTGSTLSPAHFTSGDSVWATVTPWDARDFGAPVMTDVAVVQ